MRERLLEHDDMHAAAMAGTQAPLPGEIEPFGIEYWNAGACLVHDEQTNLLRNALVPS